MEYDSLFVRVHGALISTEKLFATPFSLLDKDCADEIKEVIKVLSNILDKLDDQVSNCRRVHLFIILNTDFSAVPLIEEDENFCHLLNLLPKFSPYLYFRVMEHFGWFTFVREVIVHCPEVLSLDILKSIGAYIESVDISHVPNFLHELYLGMFEKMLKLQNCESLKKKNMYVKVFQTLLTYSVSDTLEKTNWKTLAKQQFMGKIIIMILKLLETCVYQYKRGWVGNQMDIYNILIQFDYERWNCVNHKINWSGHCLSQLISKCKKLAMEISVEMYMSWCEVDLDENQEKSLQLAVREKAYSCKEALSELNPEEFPDLPLLVSTLQNFALKPKSEDEEIESADIETIILNLQNPNRTREKWLRAFLNSPSFLSNEAHISVVKEYISLINTELAVTLISQIVEFVKNNPDNTENIEALQEIISNIVKQLSLVDQINVLSKFYEQYGNIQVLMKTTFQNSLTEVLNKVVDSTEKKEELYPELVYLCLQSGSLVVQRLLHSSLNSQELCNATVTILQELSPLSNLKVSVTSQTRVTTYEAVQILNSVENFLPQEKDNYIYLVTKLCTSALIDDHQFLADYLMSLFKSSLSKKEWDKILFWLDLLHPFVNGSCGKGVIQKPAILLAFLIEVLNKCRHRPKNYTPLSGQACENCINLLSTLVDDLVTTVSSTDCEILWLRSLASSCSPLTWYHVKKLWTHWDSQLPSDDEDILRWSKPNLGYLDISNVVSEERAKLVTSLCKVLPVLTTNEWKAIGKDGSETRDELALFHILVDGILVLSQVPPMLKNLSCLSQVVSNFLTFVMSRMITILETASHDEIIAVFDKMTILTREFPEEVIKVRSAQLLNVMQNILDIAVKTAKSEQNNTSDLHSLIMSIRDESLQSNLVRLLESATE